MNALTLIDLNASTELDQIAMNAITGGASYQWLGWSNVYSTSWAYKGNSSVYQGQTFYQGYLSKHYKYSQKYQRTQTKYARWNKYVRV